MLEKSTPPLQIYMYLGILPQCTVFLPLEVPFYEFLSLLIKSLSLSVNPLQTLVLQETQLTGHIVQSNEAVSWFKVMLINTEINKLGMSVFVWNHKILINKCQT